MSLQFAFASIDGLIMIWFALRSLLQLSFFIYCLMIGGFFYEQYLIQLTIMLQNALSKFYSKHQHMKNIYWVKNVYKYTESILQLSLTIVLNLQFFAYRAAMLSQ